MEYAIYPFRVMNITQNYNQGNHCGRGGRAAV